MAPQLGANFIGLKSFCASLPNPASSGLGGSQLLSFYFNNSSSNPVVYNFTVKLFLKRTKINKKRPGFSYSKNIYLSIIETFFSFGE